MGSDGNHDPETSLEFAEALRISKDATRYRLRTPPSDTPVRLRAEIIATVQAADFVEAADLEKAIHAAFKEFNEVCTTADLRIFQQRAPRRSSPRRLPTIEYEDD